MNEHEGIYQQPFFQTAPFQGGRSNELEDSLSVTHPQAGRAGQAGGAGQAGRAGQAVHTDVSVNPRVSDILKPTWP